MGIDRLRVNDLTRLPDVALEEMVDLLSVCATTRRWPRQALLAVGAILPKKVAGDRTMGL